MSHGPCRPIYFCTASADRGRARGLHIACRSGTNVWIARPLVPLTWSPIKGPRCEEMKPFSGRRETTLKRQIFNSTFGRSSCVRLLCPSLWPCLLHRLAPSFSGRSPSRSVEPTWHDWSDDLRNYHSKSTKRRTITRRQGTAGHGCTAGRHFASCPGRGKR